MTSWSSGLVVRTTSTKYASKRTWLYDRSGSLIKWTMHLCGQKFQIRCSTTPSMLSATSACARKTGPPLAKTNNPSTEKSRRETRAFHAVPSRGTMIQRTMQMEAWQLTAQLDSYLITRRAKMEKMLTNISTRISISAAKSRRNNKSKKRSVKSWGRSSTPWRASRSKTIAV